MATNNSNQQENVNIPSVGLNEREEVWEVGELVNWLIEAGMVSDVERSKTGPISLYESDFYNGGHFNRKFLRDLINRNDNITDLYDVSDCVEGLQESSDIIRRMIFDYLATDIALKGNDKKGMQNAFRNLIIEQINILEKTLSEMKMTVSDMIKVA